VNGHGIFGSVAALCVLQHRLQLSGVLEPLLATYSLSGDRNPPATPLYSGDEAQIREALADVIMAHATAAATAAGAAADYAQPQVQQALGTLHEQLQGLPHIQQLVLEVRILLWICLLVFDHVCHQQKPDMTAPHAS
jgi:hypothetical protein